MRQTATAALAGSCHGQCRLKTSPRPDKDDCMKYMRRENAAGLLANLPRPHRIDRISETSREMPVVWHWHPMRENAGDERGGEVANPKEFGNSRRASERASTEKKIADRNVPVDLLSRFSQPAGSSSSAIVAGIFSVFCCCRTAGSRQTLLVSITLNAECCSCAVCRLRRGRGPSSSLTVTSSCH